MGVGKPNCTELVVENGAALSSSSPALWAQRQPDFTRVWPIWTGQGVSVAVVDSGLDRSSPQLAAI